MLERLPSAFVLFVLTLLGACIGSFVNVIVARLPKGTSIVWPGSRCSHCETALRWYDNIPVFSYVFLRAKCRDCGQAISGRYPVIETLVATLFAVCWLRFGASVDLLMWLPLMAVLVAITFLDIDYWWIPDVLTWPAMAWVLLVRIAWGDVGLLDLCLGLSPAALMWLVGWGVSKLKGVDALGLGDVKLLALIGVTLPVLDVFHVLLLGSLQGVAIGAIVQLAGGHRGKPTANTVLDDPEWRPPPRAIPFGPFLVLSTLQVVLLPEVFDSFIWRTAHYITEVISS